MSIFRDWRLSDDSVCFIPCQSYWRWRQLPIGNWLQKKVNGVWADDLEPADAHVFEQHCRQALRVLVGPPPWEATQNPSPALLYAKIADLERKLEELQEISDERLKAIHRLEARALNQSFPDIITHLRKALASVQGELRQQRLASVRRVLAEYGALY